MNYLEAVGDAYSYMARHVENETDADFKKHDEKVILLLARLHDELSVFCEGNITAEELKRRLESEQ
jgi:hypothetical protein